MSDLVAIDSHESYHGYLIDHGIKMYAQTFEGAPGGLGRALAVCANYREGEVLSGYAFSDIVLSGIGSVDAYGGRLVEVLEQDPRLSYRMENCERLTFESGSFDLVFCKEGLHHLARPVLGLYEMLRVCRRAVVFVEPWESVATMMLGCFGMTSNYERNTGVNLDASRDNYVFRWSRRLLTALLRSYYLESGYMVDVALGWMSGRLFHRQKRTIKVAGAFLGWCVSVIPGFRGNFATVMIRPGADLPPDPDPFEQ